jgi:hypothetical protein
MQTLTIVLTDNEILDVISNLITGDILLRANYRF